MDTAYDCIEPIFNKRFFSLEIVRKKLILKAVMSFHQNCIFILVGLLWGATNPLIKRGSAGIDTVTSSNKYKKFLLEIKFLATRWQYIVPFTLNQCGSVLFVWGLQDSDMTIAVPVANSLSFLFTAIMAIALGENKPNRKILFGIVLVIIGISICILYKE